MQLFDDYRKVFTRNHSVFMCQIYYEAESKKLEELSYGILFFKPLFIYQKGKGVSFYYNYSDILQAPFCLFKFYNHKKDEFSLIVENFKKRLSSLQESLGSNDIKKIISNVRDFAPLVGIMNLIPKMEEGLVDEEIAKTAYKMRSISDTVIYDSERKIKDLLINKLPSEFKKLVNFLTLREVLDSSKLKISDLEERQNGYVLLEGKLYKKQDKLDKFLLNKKIKIDIESDLSFDGKLRGVVAWAGRARGVVRVVFEESDLRKVKQGDILVTPMTSPDFMLAMKRAAAFVTDEGGITCHAAIIAREMKKPCIVSTKRATQIFKDGDIVEVDADKGIISKVE